MSDIDNPFIIDAKKPYNSPKRNRYSNVWTEYEQTDKLNGYLEIAPDLWPFLKGGSHIRYITKNNEFKPGGFILKNPFEYIGETDMFKPSISINNSTDNPGKITGFRLQNYFNKQSPNYTTWVVAYDNIMKVYLKVDPGIRTVVQSLELTIENININMKKITEYIKKIDERLKKIEANR